MYGPEQQLEAPVGVGAVCGWGDLAPEDRELLAQSQVLEDEGLAAEERGPQQEEEQGAGRQGREARGRGVLAASGTGPCSLSGYPGSPVR